MYKVCLNKKQTKKNKKKSLSWSSSDLFSFPFSYIEIGNLNDKSRDLNLLGEKLHHRNKFIFITNFVLLLRKLSAKKLFCSFKWSEKFLNQA